MMIFSEREITFTHSLYAVDHPSVVCL